MVHEKAPMSVDICMETKGVCEAIRLLVIMIKVHEGHALPPTPIGKMAH